MKHLNKIVSFNTRGLYDFFGVSFSRTPAINSSLDWMGYDSRNFLQNIGLIGFLFVFIAIRQLIGFAIYIATRAMRQTYWLRSNSKLLASSP